MCNFHAGCSRSRLLCGKNLQSSNVSLGPQWTTTTWYQCEISSGNLRFHASEMWITGSLKLNNLMKTIVSQHGTCNAIITRTIVNQLFVRRRSWCKSCEQKMFSIHISSCPRSTLTTVGALCHLKFFVFRRTGISVLRANIVSQREAIKTKISRNLILTRGSYE